MPQLLKSPVTKVITKDGECEITLCIELTINLNGDLNSGAAIAATSVKTKQDEPDDDSEDSTWAIPDFNTQKIKFGKKVEE